MRDKRKSNTRRLTFAAILSALGVVLLGLGSFVEVLDLSAAVLASVFVAYAMIELRGPYPYLIYGVTALLSLLLWQTRTAALAYLLFAGYYPIIKYHLESRLGKVLSFVLKVVVFLVGGTATALLWGGLLMPGALQQLAAFWWWLLLLPVVFVLYDLALTRLITLYLLRLRRRFPFLRFD